MNYFKRELLKGKRSKLMLGDVELKVDLGDEIDNLKRIQKQGILQTIIKNYFKKRKIEKEERLARINARKELNLKIKKF